MEGALDDCVGLKRNSSAPYHYTRIQIDEVYHRYKLNEFGAPSLVTTELFQLAILTCKQDVQQREHNFNLFSLLFWQLRSDFCHWDYVRLCPDHAGILKIEAWTKML